MLGQFKERLKNWSGVILLTAGVAGGVAALRVMGLLEPLEWVAFDQYVRWNSPPNVEDRLLIVGISEADLRAVGQWPIPDGTLASLIAKLKSQEPRGIGLDIYRDFPVEPGHEDFVETFETTPYLVTIRKMLEDDDEDAVAAPPYLEDSNQVFANDVVVDADGRLRRGLLYVIDREGVISPSFGMQLALTYLKSAEIAPEPVPQRPNQIRLGKGILQRFTANDGGYIRADDGGYQILLNYRGSSCQAGNCPFRMVSMQDVLADRVPPEWVRDRVVLIGSTATSLNDFFYTPYSNSFLQLPERTSGVEIQAHIISQILSTALAGEPTLHSWSESIEILWIFVWAGVGVGLAGILSSRGDEGEALPYQTTLAVAVALGGLGVGTYLAFVQGWWIPVVPPALSLVGGTGVMTTYVAGRERTDRQAVMQLFGRYVTPAIANKIWQERNQLLSQGRILGQELTATVMFTDLRGFTQLAETMTPETLMNWLNEYMDAMSEIVLAHGGVIDKFIGDAIMVVFGIPLPRTDKVAIQHDACDAVACALAMGKRLETLNQQWQKTGYPKTAMRVGIATGRVITGSIGSNERLEYTTLGDTVNIAARLESYDKDSLEDADCRILIHEATYQYVNDYFPTRWVDKVQVRGRQEYNDVYQVVDD